MLCVYPVQQSGWCTYPCALLRTMFRVLRRQDAAKQLFEFQQESSRLQQAASKELALERETASEKLAKLQTDRAHAMAVTLTLTLTSSHHSSLTHSLTITCTCCCDRIYGAQDLKISHAHSLILSLRPVN